MLCKKKLFHTLVVISTPPSPSLFWAPFSQGETVNPFQSRSWARTVTLIFCFHQIIFPVNREAAPLHSLLPMMGFIPCFGGQPSTAKFSSCCFTLQVILQELQLKSSSSCSYTVILAEDFKPSHKGFTAHPWPAGLWQSHTQAHCTSSAFSSLLSQVCSGCLEEEITAETAGQLP